MNKPSYISPQRMVEECECQFSEAQNPPKGISGPIAQDLWKSIMRRVVKVDQSSGEAEKKIVLCAPDSTSQVLTRTVLRFMNDPKHVQEKFDGEPPKMIDVYTAAGFSKSKWGRMVSGELADIERGNVFALAVALRLNEEQTAELLYSAGLAINYEIDLDAAIMYFIRNQIYDMETIVETLSNFSNVSNGLDCFVIRPKTNKQRPIR